MHAHFHNSDLRGVATEFGLGGTPHSPLLVRKGSFPNTHHNELASRPTGSFSLLN